jgi:hypothetical protein
MTLAFRLPNHVLLRDVAFEYRAKGFGIKRSDEGD